MFMSKQQGSERTNQKSSAKAKVENKTTTAKQTRTPWYLLVMPLIVLVYGLLYFQQGEILSLNYGGGWDGTSYVYLAAAPQNEFKTDAYRSQRILPTLVVRTGAELVQRFVSDSNVLFGDLFYRWFYGSKAEFEKKTNPSLAVEAIVVYFFMWYSLGVLVLCGLLWAGVSFAAKLSFVARWLGFIVLMGNFVVMKMTLFYPTLTDVTALLLGLTALFGYVAKQQWIVLIAALGGLLTWPTAFPLAAVLFLFPRVPLPLVPNTQNDSLTAHHQGKPSFFDASRTVALAAALFMGLLTIYFLFFQTVRFPGVEESSGVAAVVNILLQMGYIALSVEIALRIMREERIFGRFLSYYRQSTVYLPVVIRVCMLIGIWGLGWFLRQGYINYAAPAPLNTEIFFAGSFSVSVAKPLLSIVAASVYFGPVIALVILLYAPILRAVSRFGVGLFIIILGTVLLGSIMTESRQLINLFPCVVFAVALTVHQTFRLSSTEIAIFLGVVGVIGVLSSKIWLSLNFPGLQDFVMKGGSYTQFPMQRYFMNHGPWMTWESYWWQAPCVVIAALLLAVVLRFIRKSILIQQT